MTTKFYDPKQDVLFIANKRSTHSIDQDTIIFDFDDEENMVGIEIDFASILMNVSKERLSKVKEFFLNTTANKATVSFSIDGKPEEHIFIVKKKIITA